MLNPEKYGYKICSHFNGYGSSLKEESDQCTKCHGTGLVKTDKIEVDVKKWIEVAGIKMT